MKLSKGAAILIGGTAILGGTVLTACGSGSKASAGTAITYQTLNYSGSNG